MNLLRAGARRTMPGETERGKAALDQITTFRATGFGYFLEQATRPQTIGYALLDSPVALAAWMLDHDTDSYLKIARAFVDEQPTGGLTRDNVLDNISLYWLTGTGASAARSYWENGHAQAEAAGQTPPQMSLPVGFTTFPGEICRTPRSWVEQATPTSSTSTRPSKAATSRPGRSRNCSRKSSGPPSDRSARAELRGRRDNPRRHRSHGDRGIKEVRILCRIAQMSTGPATEG